jgi:hypothetical protein
MDFYKSLILDPCFRRDDSKKIPAGMTTWAF